MKWIVTHTSDMETFKVDEIEGETYTRAYANAMTAFPGDIITDLKAA
jgi:hypothetical protein